MKKGPLRARLSLLAGLMLKTSSSPVPGAPGGRSGGSLPVYLGLLPWSDISYPIIGVPLLSGGILRPTG